MRWKAITAPFLLFLYGVVRWIDGWNGKRHDGPAWTVGHISFFASMALFAALVWQMRDIVRRRTAATVAAIVAILGTLSFLWVISVDLGSNFPTPGWLENGGPVLFVLGILALQGMLVAEGRLGWWSPLLFFIGYTAIAVDLNLLPFGALLVLAAFLPITRPITTPANPAVQGGRVGALNAPIRQ